MTPPDDSQDDQQDDPQNERPGGELRELAANPAGDPGGSPRGAGLLIALGLLAAVFGFAFYLGSIDPAKPHDFGDHAALLPTPRVVDPFQLTDQQGERFDRNRLVGHWSLFFFGYTYCPDVCPTTLQTLGRVKSHWESASPEPGEAPPQVVFISVDPDRDSPERIAEYVAYFDDDFVGATGSIDELEGLARSVGVFFEKVEPEAGEGASALGYLVDHSAQLYLVDPQARLRAVLDDPHDPEEFASLVRQIQRVEQES